MPGGRGSCPAGNTGVTGGHGISWRLSAPQQEVFREIARKVWQVQKSKISALRLVSSSRSASRHNAVQCHYRMNTLFIRNLHYPHISRYVSSRIQRPRLICTCDRWRCLVSAPFCCQKGLSSRSIRDSLRFTSELAASPTTSDQYRDLRSNYGS